MKFRQSVCIILHYQVFKFLIRGNGWQIFWLDLFDEEPQLLHNKKNCLPKHKFGLHLVKICRGPFEEGNFVNILGLQKQPLELFIIISQYSQKTPVLESLFKVFNY